MKTLIQAKGICDQYLARADEDSQFGIDIYHHLLFRKATSSTHGHGFNTHMPMNVQIYLNGHRLLWAIRSYLSLSSSVYLPLKCATTFTAYKLVHRNDYVYGWHVSTASNIWSDPIKMNFNYKMGACKILEPNRTYIFHPKCVFWPGIWSYI